MEETRIIQAGNVQMERAMSMVNREQMMNWTKWLVEMESVVNTAGEASA